MECIFCKIVKGEIPCNKVYEDEKTLAFLDIGPVSVGHTLVIPKKHAEFYHELDKDDILAIGKTIQKVSIAVKNAFGCDYNLINNNGKKAGQAVGHVHFHIIPRRGLPSEFHPEWPSFKYKDGEDKLILEKIKSKL